MARRLFLWTILLPLFWTGCGKKSPLELPVPRRPQAVQNLSLAQRGKTILLTWTNPTAFLDGSAIREVAACEIWIIEEDLSPESLTKKWTAAEFEAKARLLDRIERGRFASLRPKEAAPPDLVYAYSPADADLGRKVLVFSLRIRDEKKRTSEFSEPFSLPLGVPPAPPEKLRASVEEGGVNLRWEPSSGAGGYNIYRAEGKERSQLLNASPVQSLEYKDNDISFGRSYSYSVRAVAESLAELESEDSEFVEVLPRDIFPPAAPTGLTAIPGEGFIALSWEGNAESDLAGYRVWRREAGKEEFLLLAEFPATGSSFSDSGVEKNKRYEYAITALDSAGNESAKSRPVSGIMRG